MLVLLVLFLDAAIGLTLLSFHYEDVFTPALADAKTRKP